MSRIHRMSSAARAGARRSLFTIGLLAVPLAAPMLRAQAPARAAASDAPRLWLVPSGDTVVVHVLNMPATARGFIVHRRPAAGGEPQQVTPQPIRPVRDPSFAAAMLGDRRPYVAAAVRASDDVELLRRLQGDPFAGEVLALVDRDVARVLGRVHLDTGVVRGESYEYAVSLLNARGQLLGSQMIGRVGVSDRQVVAPSDVKAEPRNGDMLLTWSYPAFRGEAGDFAVGFHVYRTGAGEPERLTRLPIVRTEEQRRYVDEDVRPGQQYRYEVRAVDVTGRLSAATSPVQATMADVIPPAPPVDVATSVGDGTVLVAWRLSPEADVAGYRVERATSLDAPFVALHESLIPVRTPSYVDNTAPGGEQQFYRVIALDAAGNASEPSNAVVAVPEDHTPPAPVMNVEASIRARRMSARWSASPSPDVRGYYVYRGDAEATAPVRLTERPIPATTFADSGFAGGTGLNPGGRYRLRVTAVDMSYNESTPVDVDVLIPDDEAPAAPTALSARNMPGRHIEITWNPSPALDVREYVLTREAVGGAPAAPVEIGRFSRPGIVQDTAVSLGQRYRYAILAVDTVGNVGAAASDTVRFAEFVPPSPPRHAAARAAAPRGVEVRWERVVDGALAGYHVYRGTSPTAVAQRVTSAPVQALVFTDGEGTAEAWYHVRAVDELGNESRPSPAVRVKHEAGR